MGFHRATKSRPLSKPCKTLNTSFIFQKRCSFRASVVTSMCVPLARNQYYFFTFSNVSRIWSTFLACVMIGSNGRHNVSKILTVFDWSLTTIEIIWFVETGWACTMIIVYACTMIIVSANKCARGQGLTWQISCRTDPIASLILRLCDFLWATLIRRFSRWPDSLLAQFQCQCSRPQCWQMCNKTRLNTNEIMTKNF